MNRSGPPIFIGGLMKSGTSLLRKLIAAHPSIFGGLETHWFEPEVTGPGWEDPDSQRQRWLREFFDVSVAEVEAIRAQANGGLEFFDGFMWFCTERDGKKRWLEKTPDNVLHLDVIWDFWPEARFIHVVRDPRDVYSSWKRNGKGSLREFLTRVHRIDKHLDQHASCGDLYREVPYEFLVTETRSTLQAVMKFLDEPWVEGLDDYQGDDWDDNKVRAVTGKTGGTTVSLREPVFTRSVGQWEQELTPEEVTDIREALRSANRRWTRAFR